MHHLLNLTRLIIHYGYWGIAIMTFLESGILFALPGDSLLFTAGILAASGVINIFLIVPIIFVSTFFGGIFGFYIGENLEQLRRYSFFRLILKDEYINKAHEFFEKYGRVAVTFSRFVPVIRTFTPIVAGIAKMKQFSFIKYSLLSSFLWSTIVTLSGYFLGRSFPWLQNYMPLLVSIVVILSILPAIFQIVRKKN